LIQTSTPAGAAATELILEVFRLNGLLLAAGDRLTKPLGLTSARWQVLGALDAGPATVAQVARAMGLKRQSVQTLADALEREGLVAFAANPNHKRAMLVQMTAEGARRFAAISAIQVDWVNELSAGLAPEALKAAGELCREIQQRLLANAGMSDGERNA